MKGRSYSVIGSRIKMQPSPQEMLITKVHNLTYDVKYMKELVKVIISITQPLHEQNSRLKTNIHEMNFKIEDHFEKLMIHFSEEQ